jgi:predicted GNAT family N-acyltransferase
MPLVSFPEGEVPERLRRQAIALQQQAWPTTDPDDLSPWHDPASNAVSVLLVDSDDRVLSTLDILSARLDFGGVSYAASGISAMVTDRSRRGAGHGRIVAEAAATIMEANGADIGIFTCDHHLRSFYASAGWGHLAGSTLIGGTPTRPFPSDQFDSGQFNKVVMARFFTPKAKAAERDFVGARIPLHPGEIDRLW